MGYTQYFAYQPQAAQWRDAWPRICTDAQVIIDHAPIPLACGLGDGSPIVDGRRIWLNGVADDAHEDLLIHAPSDGVRELGRRRPHSPGNGDYLWAFTKTNRKPYDAVVGAVLIRAARHAPNTFAFASDGDWDEEWEHGAGDGAPVSARALVRELFGEDDLPDLTTDYMSGRIGPDGLFDAMPALRVVR